MLDIERGKVILDAEWCFQFNDEEPIVFAFTNPQNVGKEEQNLEITIKNHRGTNMIFTDDSTRNKFKLFVREKQYKQ